MRTEKFSAFNENGNGLSNQLPSLSKDSSLVDSAQMNPEDRTGVSSIGTELLLTIKTDHSIETAITLLHRAILYAQDCQRAVWDFAVEFSDLHSAGVSTDEIRWLVGKGIIEHALEVTPPGYAGRTFDSIGGFTFSQRSCFVLTNFGLTIVGHLSDQSAQAANTQGQSANNNEQAINSTVPSWDTERHELRFGDQLVKQYKGRAVNQIAIMNAFEEENWPARIDDPLPPSPESNSKRRLSDTIKCLNRKQRNPLIRFSGDGTGEGVLWSINTH